MIIDTSAAARRAASERVREWLGEQRVFISSAMADTAEQRRAVAAVVEEEEARAVWFEEFGRDADAQEAYLTQVDSSTVYVGIANEIYGRPNPPDGFSATEMEYMRARDGGKRLGFFVAAEAPRREGHMARFIERVRFYLTTENFTDAPDLARRVRRRLRELAAEALSPWVKVGDLVFRADEIDDVGDAVTIRGRASDEIAHQLQILRDQPHRQTDLRLVYRNRVVVGQLAGLRRTTKTGGSELAVELSRVQPPPANTMRAGTSERSAGISSNSAYARSC